MLSLPAKSSLFSITTCSQKIKIRTRRLIPSSLTEQSLSVVTFSSPPTLTAISAPTEVALSEPTAVHQGKNTPINIVWYLNRCNPSLQGSMTSRILKRLNRSWVGIGSSQTAQQPSSCSHPLPDPPLTPWELTSAPLELSTAQLRSLHTQQKTANTEAFSILTWTLTRYTIA